MHLFSFLFEIYLERSMVMLTPHAFVTPYEYLYLPETQTEARYYSDYLNDKYSTQADKALKLKVS
jgi:hypothetical protein